MGASRRSSANLYAAPLHVFRIVESRPGHHADRLDEVPTIRRPVDRRQGEIVESIHHLVVAIGHHDNGFAPGAVVGRRIFVARVPSIAASLSSHRSSTTRSASWASGERRSLDPTHVNSGALGPGQTTTSNPTSSSHPPRGRACRGLDRRSGRPAGHDPRFIPSQTSSAKPKSTSAAEWPPRTPQLSSVGSRITTETSVGSMAISPSLWTRVR